MNNTLTTIEDYLIDYYYELVHEAQDPYDIEKFFLRDETMADLEDFFKEHGIEISTDTAKAIVDTVLSELVDRVLELDADAQDTADSIRFDYKTAQGGK